MEMIAVLLMGVGIGWYLYRHNLRAELTRQRQQALRELCLRQGIDPDVCPTLFAAQQQFDRPLAQLLTQEELLFYYKKYAHHPVDGYGVFEIKGCIRRRMQPDNRPGGPPRLP